jgi:hypothetical protein
MNVMAPQIGKLSQFPSLPVHRFTVDQYHRMIEAGILGDEEPVELLEGLIVLKGNTTLVPAVHVLGMPPYRQFNLPLPVRRFSVNEYHRMIREGILEESASVELLEGWIIRNMSRNPPHDVVLALILKIIGALVPANWHWRSQSAITTDVSEPEPDMAIVRGAERDYMQHHPRPRDTGLVIEVSDTTLLSDRQLKGPLYARVGIPIYWIVNIPDSRIEMYSDPTGPDPDPAYRQRRDFDLTELVPFILDGREIAKVPVRDLLP